MNVHKLETCFNEKIDKELGIFVATVEDTNRNAPSTTIDNNITPRIELTVRSINGSSGRDAISVTANSERSERAGITAFFEKVSENNKTFHELNANGQTRKNFSDKVIDLSVPRTLFHRQLRTHHMMTRQTNQTNQVPEIPTGRILTRHYPLSQQHQNLSTQVSRDNNFPIVEHTPRHENPDSNNFINCLAEAIAGISSQQRQQTATLLKTVSTNTLIFDGNNKKFEVLKTYSTQCLTCSQK